jgi:hypothetical protein
MVEHFPKRGANEVLNRGGNMGEVLKRFTQAQRQVLQLWTEDMTAQVKEFLAERFPVQEMSRVADAFIHHLATHSPSQRQDQSHG